MTFAMLQDTANVVARLWMEDGQVKKSGLQCETKIELQLQLVSLGIVTLIA
jgi:hypothetical protein